MTSDIQTERSEQVLTVRINRPQVRNALDPAAHHALDKVFTEFAGDETLRVAIITGTGDQAFCAGSDLKARARIGKDDMPATGFAGLTERFDLGKPVIAAINGDCIGGGLEIVLACDLAITADHARFGLPEPRVGLAASGGLHRLARQLPLKQAMRLALTGGFISGPQAEACGLVTQCVDGGMLMSTALELAREIVSCAPLSIAATKQMMEAGLAALSLEAAFAGHYPAYQTMLDSVDAIEGVNAFVEKRKPVWQGR